VEVRYSKVNEHSACNDTQKQEPLARPTVSERRE